MHPPQSVWRVKSFTGRDSKRQTCAALVPEFVVEDLPLGLEALGSGGPHGPAISALDICPRAKVLFVANGRRVFAFRLEELRRHAVFPISACTGGMGERANMIIGSSVGSDSTRADAPLTVVQSSSGSATETHPRSNSRRPLQNSGDGGDTARPRLDSCLLQPCWATTMALQVNRLRCGELLACRFAGECKMERSSLSLEPVCSAVGDCGSVAVVASADIQAGRPPRQLHLRNTSPTWGIAFVPNTGMLGGNSARQAGPRVFVSANDHCVAAFEPVLDSRRPSLALEDDGLERARQRHLFEPGVALTRVLELRGHRGNIPCVDVSPGSCECASASLDGSLRTWDLLTGETRMVHRSRGRNWNVLYVPMYALILRRPAWPSKSLSGNTGSNAADRAASQLRRSLGKLTAGMLGCRCISRRSRGIDTPANAIVSITSEQKHTETILNVHDGISVQLSQDLLCACILPFLPASVLLHGVVWASWSLRRAVEQELRAKHRKEWLLLHVTESCAYLRDTTTLRAQAELKLPIRGAFIHVSCCADCSLLLLSSATESRGLLWVVRAERSTYTLEARLRSVDLLVLDGRDPGSQVLGHAVIREEETRSPPDGEGGGAGTKSQSFLYVLLSNRKLLCYRLVSG